jgi:hypothetical protein
MSYKHPTRRRCERLYTTSKTISKRLVTPGLKGLRENLNFKLSSAGRAELSPGLSKLEGGGAA